MSCYSYEKLHFDQPIFTFVQTAVILTMEDSDRLDRLKRELNDYPVCRSVIIQYNKGYKRCTKENVNSSSKDILHAVIQAFKYAQKGPIMILEDDVHFRSVIRNKAREVEEFIQTNDNWEIYSLGSLPLFSVPTVSNHVRVHYMGAAHACIFSDSMMKRMLEPEYVNNVYLKMDQGFVLKMIPSTKDFVVSSKAKAYMFRIPLAVQPHEVTDNSKLWMNSMTYYVIRMFGADRDGTLVYRCLHCTTYMGGVIPSLIILTLLLLALILYFKKRQVNTYKNES